jgi:hypothetical protein
MHVCGMSVMSQTWRSTDKEGAPARHEARSTNSICLTSQMDDRLRKLAAQFCSASNRYCGSDVYLAEDTTIKSHIFRLRQPLFWLKHREAAVFRAARWFSRCWQEANAAALGLPLMP